MTALILQARIDSSRLPGKSLLPLGGKALIFRVMEALNNIECDIKILASPEDCTSAFAPLAEVAGFQFITGSKDNVLSRFCDAVRQFKPDRIIRATGDNPFVMIDAAMALNAETVSAGADYGLYLSIPHGSGVECVSSEVLLRAEREAQTNFDKEHVCPYLYNNPDKFTLFRQKAPLCWQGDDLNLTVDTMEDYQRAQKLYAELNTLPKIERYKGENIITLSRKLNGVSLG